MHTETIDRLAKTNHLCVCSFLLFALKKKKKKKSSEKARNADEPLRNDWVFCCPVPWCWMQLEAPPTTSHHCYLANVVPFFVRRRAPLHLRGHLHRRSVCGYGPKHPAQGGGGPRFPIDRPWMIGHACDGQGESEREKERKREREKENMEHMLRQRKGTNGQKKERKKSCSRSVNQLLRHARKKTDALLNECDVCMCVCV
jgi:hypothetical protein